MKEFKTNYKQILVAMICLLSTMFVPLYAQSCFSNNYTGFTNTTDYLNVNRNNFIVTNAGSDLENYHHTAFKLAIEIGKIADVNGNEVTCSTTGFHSNTPINIMNKYTAYRVEYTPDITSGPNISCIFNTKFKLRAIVIKPNNASNAPCVFVAHGNGGVLRDWRSYNTYGVTDYLMKGYVVVLYESLATNRRVPTTGNTCPMFALPNDSPKPGVPIFQSTLTHIALLHNRWKFFSLITAQAVVKYTLSNSSMYNIDNNKLFVYGYSFGSTVSEPVLFMQKSEFPSSAYSGTPINPKNFTILSVESFNYNIKAGIVMSGPNLDQDNSSTKRDVYTLDDTTKRLLVIHAINDNGIPPGASNFGNYTTEIAAKKIPKLNVLNIKNYFLTVCNEAHNIFTNRTQFEDEALGSLYTSSPYYSTYNPFYTFVSNLTTANIGTMKAGINANPTYQQYFNTFKELNNQVCQMYKTGSQFYVNTINNTPYVVCPTENSFNRKMFINNSGVPSATYNANNWLYQIYNSECQPNSGQRKAKELEYIQEFGFKAPMLYPNPSSGIFTINVPVQEAINNYQINVFNTNGQLVNTKVEDKDLLEGDVINQTIDISNQAKGIYFVNVIGNGKIIFNESIVIK